MVLAELDQLLDTLLALDAEGLADEEVVAWSGGMESVRSKLEALSLKGLGELDRRDVDLRKQHAYNPMLGVRFRNQERWLTSENNLAWGLAGKRFRMARVGRDLLPEVWEALAQGRITLQHAEFLLGLAQHAELVTALLRDIGVLVSWAETENWPEFRQRVDRWRSEVFQPDPDDAADLAHRRRRARFAPKGDGTYTGEIITSPEVFAQLAVVIDAVYERMFKADWEALVAEVGEEHAHPTKLCRTEDQRRHDALVEAIRSGAGQQDPGVSVEVIVLCDLEVLEDEQARQLALATGAEPPARRPAAEVAAQRCQTLTGVPIDPATAWIFACTSSIRFVAANAKTLDLTITESSRLFPRSLRNALIARDQFCREPGCHTRAHRCQADHIRRYTDGGKTLPTNGQMVCPPGHRHKTRMETLGLWPREGPPTEECETQPRGRPQSR